MVQWLRLQAPNAGAGSIPGQESRSLMLQLTILHAATKKKKKKRSAMLQLKTRMEDLPCLS